MPQSLRILLAENNTADVAILKHILAEFNTEIHLADSLQELIEDGHQWDPEVILIDLHIEEDQDFMVTARRVVTEFPNIPVLAVTNLEGEEFALRALRAGISAYLIKGTLSGSDLMRDIREAQARKRAQHLSMPPGINKDEIREMVRSAVNEAIQEPEEPVPSSIKTIILIVIGILLFIGGVSIWVFYELNQAREEKPQTPKDEKELLFQEFQKLREEYANEKEDWENQGRNGPRPIKPKRMTELEQQLAR